MPFGACPEASTPSSARPSCAADPAIVTDTPPFSGRWLENDGSVRVDCNSRAQVAHVEPGALSEVADHAQAGDVVLGADGGEQQALGRAARGAGRGATDELHDVVGDPGRQMLVGDG